MAQLIFWIKNLVGFERDLLHGMFVSQQWQWQSSEDYPSLQDTHIYSIYIYIIIYNTIQTCVLYSINIKMIGHAANLVNYTLMSIYWGGSCATYLFILK